MIELNPEYVDIAAARLRAHLCQVQGVEKTTANAGPLFDFEVG